MEPLNLMVSLSHFANANREHKHGLSEPAGRGRTNAHAKPARSQISWRFWFANWRTDSAGER
ncbi:hypothetical protein AB0E63_24390 [Kribbella sp. NPDC026596]|uniref:hypothetical protein n=1 Tax=Kribbella sp. NPDC026596 TaxID=3155122 RepID=UPI0033C4661C